MQNQKWEIELIRPAQFLTERADRFFSKFRVFCPGINEVAGVPKDYLRPIRAGAVGRQLDFGKWFGKPLHIVLYENLDGGTSNRSAALKRFGRSACGGHVSAE